MKTIPEKNSILIVDDEKANISILRSILAPLYTVYAASEGQEAIETANEFLPDVILLDIIMPDIDGYEVINRLKNSERTRSIPVIFITGLKNQESEEKGLASGASDYITKPFNAAIVKLRVRNQIEIVNYARAQKALKELETANEINRKSLSTLENILTNIDEFIYVTDKDDDTILFMNNSMKEHYNLPDNVEGTVCWKVLQEGFEKRCEFCQCHQLDQDPTQVVRWTEQNTLTKRTYRNSDRYINWIDGKTVHLQHSVDITELVEAKNAAESANRAKSVFLSHISHEIRTPMNAILGIAEIQLHGKDPDSETSQAFGKIFENGDMLLKIMNDILDISKIEADKLELVHAQYDLPSIVTDSVVRNRLQFESKPIELIVDFDEKTPYNLKGDALRIKQVLNNILSNAFKYTDEGKIVLNVSIQEYAGEPPFNTTLVIKVGDTGQGMSDTQLELLFADYVRFNMNTNRSISGAGLGMSITKRLVERMGGTISVESSVGKGSTFTVEIPQERINGKLCGNQYELTAKGVVEEKINKSQIQRLSGKVLIVDDMTLNIHVAAGLLKPYGLEIDSATSGFEVLDKVAAGNVYDIIFMDHMMPKMDGIETTKKLREEHEYNHAIVALTANAMIGSEELFLANGFDAFLSKPIDSRELGRVLNKYVRDSKNAQTLSDVPEPVKKPEVSAKVATISPQAAQAIVQDIDKTITTLEEMLSEIRITGGAACQKCTNGKTCETCNISTVLYTTTTHGIKRAFTNIGETELANAAQELELFGKAHNVREISERTPAFIRQLCMARVRYL